MQTHLELPTSTDPRIVIIGGGFGGIQLAKELKNKPFQVILIDRNNYHTFQPLLYQVATGGLEPDSIAFPLRKIFQGIKNVFFRMAEVEDINTLNKTIKTDIGNIKYDYLVIATGSTNNFWGMKDIEKNAMPLKSLKEALDLRSLVLQNLEKALNDPKQREACMNFVVVGGGPTGVEVAGALGELTRHVLPNDYPELNKDEIDIYLVESNKMILASMAPQTSAKALTFLTKLGVQVILNTRLQTYDGEKVKLSNGTEILACTVIWSAGVQGQTITGIPSASIQKGNRFIVNRYNQIEGLENVFAIGDVAGMVEEKYPNGHPMVAPVAIQQGKLLAKNLVQLINNNPLKQFTYKDKGSMATIGRNKAVVEIGAIRFQGAFAWFTWLAVHLMSLVGFRNRIVVLFNWMWNYLSYDRAIRIIVRPFIKKED